MINKRISTCFLCDNTGLCIYEKNGYEYAARCICAYGRNPNKFSMAEINKDYVSQENTSARNTAYIPTIKENLGDRFPIYLAEKKCKKVEKPGISNEEMLKKLNEIDYQFKQLCQIDTHETL